ncbi:hypothetical protein QOT17_000185 [Balamuthia mandrillaris]
MEGEELAAVEGQVGTLTMDLSGSVLHSSGELASDDEAPKILYRMLQDSNALITSAGEENSFKRLTITNSKHCFVVVVSKDRVLAVKKKL